MSSTFLRGNTFDRPQEPWIRPLCVDTITYLWIAIYARVREAKLGLRFRSGNGNNQPQAGPWTRAISDRVFSRLGRLGPLIGKVSRAGSPGNCPRRRSLVALGAPSHLLCPLGGGTGCSGSLGPATECSTRPGSR